MNKQLKVASKHLGNVFGWKTKRKIMVIEVDDYGTTSVSTEEQVNAYLNLGKKLDFFTLHDRITSPQELADLFEVLNSVKDSRLRPAIITPLTVMANPDYSKIESSGFNEYFYEDIVQTFERTYGAKLFKLWKEGINAGLWRPEFHGREHFNVRTWMNALQKTNSSSRIAFQFGICGVFDQQDLRGMERFGAAFDFMEMNELSDQIGILREGLKLFRETFGYSPVLFTPPNGICSEELEPVMISENLQFLTMPKVRNAPKGNGKMVRRFHYYRQKGNSGIMYTPRNCQFEPHNFRESDWVASCLRDMQIAFQWQKPAIVSSHRLNFIRQTNKENGNGLNELKRLLTKAVQLWPDIEFMSTHELSTVKS